MSFSYGREVSGRYSVTFCSGPSWFGMFFHPGKADKLELEAFAPKGSKPRESFVEKVERQISRNSDDLLRNGIAKVTYDASSTRCELIEPACVAALRWAREKEPKLGQSQEGED